MNEPSSMISMMEQDRQISDVIAKERSRLRNFIRKRVPNEADVEDLLQEVFCELIEANRLLMPIDFVTGWPVSAASSLKLRPSSSWATNTSRCSSGSSPSAKFSSSV